MRALRSTKVGHEQTYESSPSDVTWLRKARTSAFQEERERAYVTILKGERNVPDNDDDLPYEYVVSDESIDPEVMEESESCLSVPGIATLSSLRLESWGVQFQAYFIQIPGRGLTPKIVDDLEADSKSFKKRKDLGTLITKCLDILGDVRRGIAGTVHQEQRPSPPMKELLYLIG